MRSSLNKMWVCDSSGQHICYFTKESKMAEDWASNRALMKLSYSLQICSDYRQKFPNWMTKQ